jgi:hypothetical protein
VLAYFHHPRKWVRMAMAIRGPRLLISKRKPKYRETLHFSSLQPGAENNQAIVT